MLVDKPEDWEYKMSQPTSSTLAFISDLISSYEDAYYAGLASDEPQKGLAVTWRLQASEAWRTVLITATHPGTTLSALYTSTFRILHPNSATKKNCPSTWPTS